MTSDSLADDPARPAPPSLEESGVPVVASAEGEGEQHPLVTSELGSGLLAEQPTVEAQTIAVLKVCPQCGTEYETAARFCPADGTALRPKGSDSLIGRVLADRYHILKLIGEGGMGRVYLGEHVKMNRQCALKVMSPALVNDAESAARFAREASNAARIIHPNVAAVFDYGESDGLVYLVMEYVDGEPLSRLLAREAPFSLERATELARQIADGLGAAHELEIVHRDLKPDNILVSRKQNGREVVKVVDFGIAKAMQENAGEALTRTGLVIGTPEFMSPEQLLGDPIDARSDLYALGCILHLMLTAAPAFEAPTREQMIKRRLSEDPPSVQGVDPGLPDSIDRIVARLLARAPGDRYGSAAEVRDALGGTHARRVGPDGASKPRMDTPRSAPTQIIEAAAPPVGATPARAAPQPR
jgi:serine/threonine-protein kinase